MLRMKWTPIPYSEICLAHRVCHFNRSTDLDGVCRQCEGQGCIVVFLNQMQFAVFVKFASAKEENGFRRWLRCDKLDDRCGLRGCLFATFKYGNDATLQIGNRNREREFDFGGGVGHK